ncbi:hypothetical protein OH76DRAFT_1359698 [Lentinus brumalis]|uniref:Hydrophobin n=1 Tax=Lentinus brumalis TaxID=2498619 RepID=A0A371CVL3_9APHY|nr:hypothetical protein OH76DRAFT_1359698 [Polyporus brumalis]
MISLSMLALALSAFVVTTVRGSPLITPAPALDLPSSVPTAAAAASTIGIAQCLATIQCCQSTIPVDDVIPASIATLIPTLPVPLPTLGPLLGVQCSAATDLNIIGNQCLMGGTPVCCEEVLPRK